MVQINNAQVVARGQGRLRIAIPQLYRSRALQVELEREWSRRDGVIAVYANPLTARVLILFEPALQGAALLAQFGIEVEASLVEARQPRPGAARAAKAPPPPPQRQQPSYSPWHLRTPEEALAFFGSSRRRGLSQAEAAHRLLQGQNLLSKQAPVSSLDILLNQFKNLPTLLLGASAAVSVATGGRPEAAAIAAVLALNGGIGFATERRAEATIASLAELVDDVVPVLRDGAVRQVESSHLVPGDLLVLAPGVRIGADARLLQAGGLSVDESALTGESMPSPKHSATLSGATPLAERGNMAYRGTAVSSGSGLALVVGTGNNTEVGAIQALTGGTRRPRTPIQNQLDQLGNQLVKVSGAICLGIFGLGLLRGYPWLRMLKTSISLAIAALPEGLPAVATTSLARGIVRMREHQVLMRRLHAVETIGAIQTICLDKTGTLTMNRMSAVALHTRAGALWAGHDGHDELKGLARAASGPARAEISRLLHICVLCNQAEAQAPQPDSPLNGSATESALLELAAGAGVDQAALRRRHRVLDTELRMEGRNYMRTVHALPDSPRRLIAVKGSPSEVLQLCSHYLDGERAPALDQAARDDIARQNDAMAARQLRVLGFGYAEAAPGEAEPALTWVGLVGLADPLRPGVERVIASFHDAGIRTVMLTGDQAATAYVIGQSLHLNNGDPLHIVDAGQLEEIAPRPLQALADSAHIFSRVSPARKLQIVRALQQGGKTIAMTGDGINDGPALRAADIGIAMGGGTDVALSVADVVLKDDRLETLLEAVRQGRTISNNIRKSLHFLLSSNLSEILVVLGSVVLGSGQPPTPIQLLWLNLLSDLLPAIALVAEPAEGDVMQQAPRDPRRPIVGPGELRHYAREAACLAGGTLGAYLYGAARHGDGGRAGTIAFNALVLGQLLHALSCRSERRRILSREAAPPNHQLTLAVGASAGLQVAANLLPGLRRALGLAPMGLGDVLAMLAGAGLPLLVNELAKPGTPAGREHKTTPTA